MPDTQTKPIATSSSHSVLRRGFIVAMPMGGAGREAQCSKEGGVHDPVLHRSSAAAAILPIHFARIFDARPHPSVRIAVAGRSIFGGNRRGFPRAGQSSGLWGTVSGETPRDPSDLRLVGVLVMASNNSIAEVPMSRALGRGWEPYRPPCSVIYSAHGANQRGSPRLLRCSRKGPPP